jgi:steroid delta-isomerase-like uncharacterized protein
MSTASTRSAEEIARESFRIIFEERDLSGAGRFWSDRSTDHFIALGRSITGKTALTAFFHGLFDSFPDFDLHVDEIVSDGDRRAVVRWSATGTFTGAPWEGIEATGSRVAIQGVDVVRFDAEGRVDENTVFYDGTSFARQIGMLPKQGSAADRAMLTAFNAATKVRKRARSADFPGVGSRRNPEN